MGYWTRVVTDQLADKGRPATLGDFLLHMATVGTWPHKFQKGSFAYVVRPSSCVEGCVVIRSAGGESHIYENNFRRSRPPMPIVVALTSPILCLAAYAAPRIGAITVSPSLNSIVNDPLVHNAVTRLIAFLCGATATGIGWWQVRRTGRDLGAWAAARRAARHQTNVVKEELYIKKKELDVREMEVIHARHIAKEESADRQFQQMLDTLKGMASPSTLTLQRPMEGSPVPPSQWREGDVVMVIRPDLDNTLKQNELLRLTGGMTDSKTFHVRGSWYGYDRFQFIGRPC